MHALLMWHAYATAILLALLVAVVALQYAARQVLALLALVARRQVGLRLPARPAEAGAPT